MGEHVTIVEVGPRDGFQLIVPLIPTVTKIALVEQLYAAGLRRMEATAFVSARSIPQLADAAEVLAAARALPGLSAQVLVPTQRRCEQALGAGATEIAFVLSASEAHNMENVRRTPRESVDEYRRLIAVLPAGVGVRLNLATAFDCPFTGAVAPDDVLALLDPLVAVRPDVEIALCDTTGRATPERVRALFDRAIARFPDGTRWAFHGHDTYGLGVANVLAAYDASVRVFDSSFAGLGGCPFAPGATGNVATEDVVWTFGEMGAATGIDLDLLLDAAEAGAQLPGALPGGRVRTALRSRQCVQALAA
ncbi:Hydroxymethylglutaryl-CoA lyase YngG (plasmid) [Sphingobium sp. AntQ-1]|uniref:hydroxymethylglutaryl-CoA lyase n=1 Tax=Sphingobium sp. AntQ-1 TaxID=2930091 RepID=UPI00234E85FC|nr:hydroxymethylglutaryl-CoA lyase [Sphingobium sp. AntQ-1]WCP16250.1 Hydroxymethylglutaryl-CoA lyase YngG [Sphingobium sp. AntQ-1]